MERNLKVELNELTAASIQEAADETAKAVDQIIREIEEILKGKARSCKKEACVSLAFFTGMVRYKGPYYNYPFNVSSSPIRLEDAVITRLEVLGVTVERVKDSNDKLEEVLIRW